jgi:hypothetical protein
MLVFLINNRILRYLHELQTIKYAFSFNSYANTLILLLLPHQLCNYNTVLDYN